MSEYILEMKGITKEFPGVKALDNVNFKVKKGEIHALVGENGAGKSTLMKILSGLYPFGTYEGEIIMNGEVKHFNNIKESELAGIAIIYQELALVKQMTIAENIFLGHEVSSGGVINWNKTYTEAEKALKEVKLQVNALSKVLNLGVGEQQLVEIAKALFKKNSILILDEPTSALTETETDNLLDIIRHLKDKGITCIFITHRLKEVFLIADNITTLRDGKTIDTECTIDMDENKLICKMVGREISNIFPRKKHSPGNVVLDVKNWTVIDPETEALICDNISFQARKGEILGIAGLMGAGRTEMAMSIFGVYGKVISGEIILDGKLVESRNTHNIIKNGLSLLPEDRKKHGLVLMMDIKENTTLPSLDKISSKVVGIINKNLEVSEARKWANSLKTKTPSLEQKARNLSGGNQQKVVIGKWLMTEPKVLILDEPTRGIDVGAKFEIYNIMNRLVDEGVCVIMISSELPEVLGMSDRIMVIHEGKVSAILPYQDATQEKVMYYATGGK